MTAGSPRAGTDVVATVLVPVRDEARHLRETVEAIRAQRFEEPVEFLFVEGRSADGTRALLEELTAGDPRMRILDNPGRTIPCALNIGLREARGTFVARFDAHTRYPEHYLAAGIERLRRGDVASVSGPQIPHGVGRWSRRVALALGSWLGTGGAAFRRVGESELEVLSGFGGIWRRDTLQAVGGWDETFAVNEDAEIAARIREQGGRIVCVPGLAAHYVPRDSLSGLFRQYIRYGHYRAKTVRRHPDSLRRAHLLAPGVALAVLAAVLGPRGARRRARVGLGCYAIAVASATADCAWEEEARDVAGVATVYVVMHVGWGLGFLAGCARFGVPFAALRQAYFPSSRE